MILYFCVAQRDALYVSAWLLVSPQAFSVAVSSMPNHCQLDQSLSTRHVRRAGVNRRGLMHALQRQQEVEQLQEAHVRV